MGKIVNREISRIVVGEEAKFELRALNNILSGNLDKILCNSLLLNGFVR